LGSLDKLVKEWIYKVTLKKTKSEAIAGEAGGKIFTMGSYRLGVHQKGADIDTLILSPKHIDREDFFTDFYEMLLKSPEVSKLTVSFFILLFFYFFLKKIINYLIFEINREFEMHIHPSCL